MEENSSYLCSKCGKYFNHKIQLAVHNKYQHPKSASLSRHSDNFDQSGSDTVKLREFANENKKPWELHFTQGTNVEVACTEVLQLNNESFQQMHEISLQRSVSLSGDKSSPVLTDDDDYGRPQKQSQEGLLQNENDAPSIGTSPSSDQDSKNVKRKRNESEILREPQNKLQKISTPSSFSEALPEECPEGVETSSQRSKNKQPINLQRNATERRFSCKFCKYRSNNRSHLQDHEWTHTGEKPYKCHFCDYSSSTARCLRDHERTHTGDRPYQCGSCDYTAKTSTAMSYHLKIHAGEKPYKCQYCEYSSRASNHLKTHERTHTGEKPYKCKHCSYSSTQGSSLRQHERTHTGEKPYKCQYCDYRSSTGSCLRRHERTHTGEKPYQCGSCDYAAKNYRNMLAHVKTHTVEKP